MMEDEHFVNSITGELKILHYYDEKYETLDYKTIWENRNIWRKISPSEYDFYVLIGESYMKDQENLNQKDE